MADGSKLVGLLAQYENVDALMAACRKVRDAGTKNWDSLTPFPVHGIEAAMGIKRTILPKIVFVAGATGLLAALGMQSWMNGLDYQFVVSGKPFISLPQQIPIIFEVTVLFSALTAFGMQFVLNGLPQLYHPYFNSQRFRRVTTDGLFIVIDADDPKFDAERTRAMLNETGASIVEPIYEPEDA